MTEFGSDTCDAKVVLLGDSGVGKTSLVHRYVKKTFIDHIPSTIGAAFMTQKLFINNYNIRLQIWDTAGQERFRSLTPMYYRGASAALLIYDTTRKETFEAVKEWVEELQKNIETEESSLVIAIVGNKVDLVESREVLPEMAEKYAAGIGAIFTETSAKEDKGITDLFADICTKLIYKHEINTGIRVEESKPSSTISITTTPNKKTDTGCCK
eukprot:TRINITY_DN2647_c0_g1_i1.p1 TRINITY_DN2647_c0_g1~~TRINITY_DN2647_c0_g1_i1.p1  ORF type:complete len:231 (-),score=29.60 TRINITY_DN2647_c0_g1_i1:86-721(-)